MVNHLVNHLVKCVQRALSGVVYNFGTVCLSVCDMITFESIHIASSFLHIRVKFIYDGYKVKVKVKVNPYSHNVQLQSATSI